jgi:hypothetical protein
MTRTVLARALAAAAVLLAPLPATAAAKLCADTLRADPVGTTACPGVRPGAVLQSGTERCTFGFLFQGSDKRRYAATAGHCAFATDPATDPGQTSAWRKANGPVVKDADGRQVGRFAYATMVGQFADFALVRLDKGVTSSPQMCHFGGPTRLTTAIHNDDVHVQHYGQGNVTGSLVPARTGDAFFGLYKPDYVYFYGAATEGDSGSPVVTADGEAVGVITDLTTPFTGNVGVNRLATHVAAAQKALKIRLTLLTAPRL